MQDAGFYETTVFVHHETRDAMDAAIARGQFATRREAMEYAITSVFHPKESATPRQPLRKRKGPSFGELKAFCDD